MSNNRLSPFGDASGDWDNGVRKIANNEQQTGGSGGTNADFARLFHQRRDLACDMPVVFGKAGSEQERRVVDPTTGDTFEGCEQDVLSAVREHYAAQCWEIELDLNEAWANEPGVGDAYARFATDEIVAHVRDNWDTPEPSEN